VDFRLPPEVAAWQARMRAFVESELVSREHELPPFASHLPPASAAEVVRRLRAEGLWALAVPREHGGQGLGIVGLCALREALGHTTAWSLARLLGSEPPILLYEGSEDQKRRYLLPAVRGELSGCFALTEPGAGSDAGAITLRAEPDGSGHYVLHGRKIFTSHADEADFALVFGVVPPGETAGGITLFIVDMDSPGLRLLRRIETMGGDRPSELVFEGCRVPAANVVGTPGQAFALAQRWFVCDRIALQPPICLGAAARCLRLAGEAGVAPPAAAAMFAARIAAARAMLYHAAWRFDAGEDVRHEASLLKAAATTLALEVVDAAMDWFGPAGSCRDLPFERYHRDLRRFPIAAGTFEMQQFIVARGLLRGYAGLDLL
jgi:acyl-CoA dehydrogenase